MERSKSKYQSTAAKMDMALIKLLEKKNFEYITVKEICEAAGVNRSTFYLHYETVADLLDECEEYVNRQCFDRYGSELKKISGKLMTADESDLIFISPEYLKPYFEFVRDYKSLFKVVMSKPAVLNAQKTFNTLFKEIFSPILDRFHFPDADKPYIISFYVSGMMAIVSEWIKNDCKMPIERIIEICMQCILPNKTM